MENEFDLICALIVMYFCCWFSEHLVSKKNIALELVSKLRYQNWHCIKKNGMMNSVQKGASYMLKVGSSSSNL